MSLQIHPRLIYQSLTNPSRGVNCLGVNLHSAQTHIWKASMSRKSFSQEMQEVKNEILPLASMVEEAVMESAQALKDNDLDLRTRFSRTICALTGNALRSRYPLSFSWQLNDRPLAICAGWLPIWGFARNWSVWEIMQRGLPISISVRKA